MAFAVCDVCEVEVEFEVDEDEVVEEDVDAGGVTVIWIVVTEFRYPVFEVVAVMVHVVVFVKLLAVKFVT